MSKIALVFTGQGTQYVGMGRDLYDGFETVRLIFDRAEEIIKIDVAGLCFKGPQNALDLTVNTQISIFTMEIAIYNLVRSLMPALMPVVMAGHSLGEYSAIYAAGAINLDEVLSLVYSRAQYHHNVIPAGGGAMAAIIGLDPEVVYDICVHASDREEMVDIAVFNAPKQVTVSGHLSAVDKVMIRAKEKNATSVIKLPISVPCHSRLLGEVAVLLKADLDCLDFKDFKIPVIPNCNPDLLYTKDNAKDLMQAQIVSPVRWQETVEKMAIMGVDTIIEIGPKKTLSNLIKRIDRRFHLLNIKDIESLRTVQAFFQDISVPSARTACSFKDKSPFPSL